MILLLAVVAGVVFGVVRAWFQSRPYQTPELRFIWLVLLAVIPQLFTFHVYSTAKLIPDYLAPFILVSTQILLIVFVWVNRKKSGFWALGIGLGLNFLVIILNGGLMPICPEAVTYLIPNAPNSAWAIGDRLGTSKNIVLSIKGTRLAWMSDYIMLPAWIPWRVAYSVGDIGIALGAFLLLWEGDKPSGTFN